MFLFSLYNLNCEVLLQHLLICLNFEKSLCFLCSSFLSFEMMESKLISKFLSSLSIWWVMKCNLFPFSPKVWMPTVYWWCSMEHDRLDLFFSDLKVINLRHLLGNMLNNKFNKQQSLGIFRTVLHVVYENHLEKWIALFIHS